jgi:hypothetical protein
MPGRNFTDRRSRVTSRTVRLNPSRSAVRLLHAPPCCVHLNNGEKCAAEVREYLRTEIEKKPVRLGRLAVWLFPHEHAVASNKDALLRLRNVEMITELLDQFREKAWSTEEEKGAVERLRELLQ